METIKHKGIKMHIGCGGEVVKRRCIKCGEKEERKGLGEKVFGTDPLIIDGRTGPVDREEHRRRIQSGRDIFK